MFVTAVPGLGPPVSGWLAELPGVTVLDAGFDGRSDLVRVEVVRGSRAAVAGLGVTEDVFVEVGHTPRSESDAARTVAGRLWRPARVTQALSVWAEEVRPLSRAMTFRVIARVLQERSFLRTELRRQLTETIARDRPSWRVDDPARIEVWISEYAAGRLVAGLRLSDATMRQHDGRRVEREGALRPTVAAAMVRLAGAGPDSEPGALLDPCCGSGTILAEATAAGWAAQGVDIDPSAVDAARANAPTAAVRAGDARALSVPDASVDACVANLPFGRQYDVPGDRADWLRAVLGEMARVTRPGGRVVVLVPDVPRGVVPGPLRLCDRFPLRLLGVSTTIWAYDRT